MSNQFGQVRASVRLESPMLLVGLIAAKSLTGRCKCFATSGITRIVLSLRIEPATRSYEPFGQWLFLAVITGSTRRTSG